MRSIQPPATLATSKDPPVQIGGEVLDQQIDRGPLPHHARQVFARHRRGGRQTAPPRSGASIRASAVRRQVVQLAVQIRFGVVLGHRSDPVEPERVAPGQFAHRAELDQPVTEPARRAIRARGSAAGATASRVRNISTASPAPLARSFGATALSRAARTRQIGCHSHGLDGRRGAPPDDRPAADPRHACADRARFRPAASSGTRCSQPSACARAASARISAAHLRTRRLYQNRFQHDRRPRNRRPLPRVEPSRDLSRHRTLGQGPVQRLDRHRPLDGTPPGQIDLARRSGLIAGAQQVHRIAQLPCPFGAPGEAPHRPLPRAAPAALATRLGAPRPAPAQDAGGSAPRPTKTPHLQGFRRAGGDPGRHPG